MYTAEPASPFTRKWPSVKRRKKSVTLKHYWNWIVKLLYNGKWPKCLLWMLIPVGSPSCGRHVTVYVWHNPVELAHPFLFCSCVYFCLYGPFNCISFHKFSWQLSTFSLCFSCLILALLVLSTIYFLIKVSISPDIILCVWLGLKHQLTNTEQANILFCAWLPSW